jgi:hypothetical protein
MIWSLFQVFGSPLWAEALSYDRYAPVFRKEPVPPSAVKDLSQHSLVAPLELVRWPVDKTLVYIEKHRIDTKARWMYDEIVDQGITPHFGFVSPLSPSFGMDADMVRILRQKDLLPDATVKAWIHYASGVYFQTGSKVGMDQIAGTGLRTSGFFQYEHRPQEHFYGLGPNSSAGDGSVYEMESTTLEPSAGYAFSPSSGVDFKFGYRNINISGGKDGGRGQVGQTATFSRERVPGIDEDSLITLGLEYRRDTRNHKEDSTSGGEQRFGFSFNEGVQSSGARYFKYELEASQYVSLWSKRRVLVFHLYGEHNDELNNGYVPFHQMAKLGGYGVAPRLSHTLRGFDFNRFFDESAALFNLEYRYTIWEYRDLKVDSVIFWDEGQVFSEFSKFQFKDFRESYGLGFRLSAANNILLTVEVAHGDEGTNFYVKSQAPF